jgi:hypothetical protein
MSDPLARHLGVEAQEQQHPSLIIEIRNRSESLNPCEVHALMLPRHCLLINYASKAVRIVSMCAAQPNYAVMEEKASK